MKQFVVIGMDNREIADRVCKTTAVAYKVYTHDQTSKFAQLTVWGPISNRQLVRALFK